MNRKTGIVLLSVLVLVSISFYIFIQIGNSPVDKAENHESNDLSQQVATQAESMTKPRQLEAAKETETVETDPYQDQAIQAQMQQIADLYEQAARYPHFSQPILNPDQVREPEPFEETEVDLPFPDEDGRGEIRLAAAVDRYQYFQGDAVQARLEVSGAASDAFIQVQGLLKPQNGSVAMSQALVAQGVTQNLFTGVFDTNLVSPADLTEEMVLELQVSVGDQALFTSVPFRYSSASAQLVGIPYVRPEREYLLIPLQYSVFQPGYYFARAILEDAQTGQPLLQLQDEDRLQQGNGLLVLRAHIQALKAMGSEGPYVLRSIQTYRGAEVGEAYDVNASAIQQRFDIPAFSFDQYTDQTYQDELAQERLDFLRAAGSINTEEENETDN